VCSNPASIAAAGARRHAEQNSAEKLNYACHITPPMRRLTTPAIVHWRPRGSSSIAV
jgi:hypothetical protein